jgi:hypothetical protein
MKKPYNTNYIGNEKGKKKKKRGKGGKKKKRYNTDHQYQYLTVR